MVLQRGKPNTFWGWTKPGETVRIELAGKSAKATAGKDGRWEIKIEPPKGVGPYSLALTGSQSITLNDFLVGDVWLCGGQSNMEFPLSRAQDGEADVKAADHPEIRFFVVKSQPAYAPAQTVQGTWRVCSPESVTQDGGVPAVAYYFAMKVQQETGVPIGLIKDCVGGTPAEAWTSSSALRKLKEFDSALDEVQRLHGKGGPEYGNYVMHWYDEYDAGQKNNAWASPELDESDWKTVMLPGGFRELGVPDAPSVCYFRKTIELPEPLPTGPAVLKLGVVEKMDTTQINGKWVGASAWVENPRSYFIGKDVLKPGKNIITVRVFKTKADGGFQSKSGDLKLVLGDETEIPLAGEWKGKLSVDAKPPHPLPLGFENWPVMPSVLYSGMIAPIAPIALTGALWYQGEANTSKAYQYRTLLPAMIADWRATFRQGDFPFYVVSLPAFMQRHQKPGGEDGWTQLREAHLMTGNTVRNCATVVTVDTGDANDIHPRDKKVVGERLARVALAKHYGKQVTSEGPTFASLKQIPGALEIHFTHTDGGLVVKGEKLGEFAIAGEDHKWEWADAKIVGNTVVVSSAKMPQPIAVRYAWQANPVATLYNGAGLPACPFRTDDWSKDSLTTAR